ncbi:MAG: hypothetical protein R2843_01535 [Thermomicrobiales bacterium]
MIAECVAHIRCSVRDRVSIGDHDLFIAIPMRVTALEEAFNGVWLTENDAGRVCTISAEIVSQRWGRVIQGTMPEPKTTDNRPN